MGAGMTIPAHDQAAGQAQAKLGPDDMNDALAGLVDVEHLDAAGRGFGSQRGQQLQSDLDGAGAPMRRGDGMVRCRECQLRIVDLEAPTLEIEQSARTTEIMQQMTVDMEEIGVFAHSRNDMLVPDLGQQRTAGYSQNSPPFWLLRPAAPAANRRFARLIFRS